jgi:chromate transporter
VTILLAGSVYVQVGVILIGGLLGFVIIKAEHPKVIALSEPTTASVFAVNHTRSIILGMLVVALFFALPFVSNTANDFYRTGALVFGGGHVVLPLLEEAVVTSGQVSQTDFLAGYGATQAVPGPMFTFAAYLGFLQADDGGLLSAFVATLFIFLPGFLMVLAIYPVWQKLAANAKLQNVIAGANAAVVGLLAAALYNPIFVHAIHLPIDVAIAALAYAGLARYNVPVLWVALGCVAMKGSIALF